MLNLVPRIWFFSCALIDKQLEPLQCYIKKTSKSHITEFMVLTKFISIDSTAGSCVTSDTRIIRDIFYNGNPIREKCTIILRIAPTFLR